MLSLPYSSAVIALRRLFVLCVPFTQCIAPSQKLRTRWCDTIASIASLMPKLHANKHQAQVSGVVYDLLNLLGERALSTYYSLVSAAILVLVLVIVIIIIAEKRNK